MRIAIASDHGGFCQKELISDFCREAGHEVIDLGPDSAQSVDYPDFATLVAHKVSSGEAERGILICGTGIGMALCADKVAGVRAAAIDRTDFAHLFREHNNGNIICLSGRFVAPMDNCEIVKEFLETEFAGGRHEQRVAKIMREDAC